MTELALEPLVGTEADGPPAGFVDTTLRVYSADGRLLGTYPAAEFRRRRTRCGLHPTSALREDGSCRKCAFDGGGRLTLGALR